MTRPTLTPPKPAPIPTRRPPLSLAKHVFVGGPLNEDEWQVPLSDGRLPERLYLRPADRPWQQLSIEPHGYPITGYYALKVNGYNWKLSEYIWTC